MIHVPQAQLFSQSAQTNLSVRNVQRKLRGSLQLRIGPYIPMASKSRDHVTEM